MLFMLFVVILYIYYWYLVSSWNQSGILKWKYVTFVMVLSTPTSHECWDSTVYSNRPFIK